MWCFVPRCSLLVYGIRRPPHLPPVTCAGYSNNAVPTLYLLNLCLMCLASSASSPTLYDRDWSVPVRLWIVEQPKADFNTPGTQFWVLCLSLIPRVFDGLFSSDSRTLISVVRASVVRVIYPAFACVVCCAPIHRSWLRSKHSSNQAAINFDVHPFYP